MKKRFSPKGFEKIGRKREKDKQNERERERIVGPRLARGARNSVERREKRGSGQDKRTRYKRPEGADSATVGQQRAPLFHGGPRNHRAMIGSGIPLRLPSGEGKPG